MPVRHLPAKAIWTVADLEALPDDGFRYEVWLVDLDARAIERWTAASEFPEVERDRVSVRLADDAPALELDIPSLFTPPA